MASWRSVRSARTLSEAALEQRPRSPRIREQGERVQRLVGGLHTEVQADTRQVALPALRAEGGATRARGRLVLPGQQEPPPHVDLAALALVVDLETVERGPAAVLDVGALELAPREGQGARRRARGCSARGRPACDPGPPWPTASQAVRRGREAPRRRARPPSLRVQPRSRTDQPRRSPLTVRTQRSAVTHPHAIETRLGAFWHGQTPEGKLKVKRQPWPLRVRR